MLFKVIEKSLRNIEKKAITLEKTIFQKFEKTFLDNIHLRNVIPKFEISRLNGVAVIAKTYIHTYIHTHPHTHTHTAELR